MKPILLLAAGALGAAGLITMAAPASAASGDQPATSVNGTATQPQQFQTNLQNQRSDFKDSIDPAKLADGFLYSGGDSHGRVVPGMTMQVPFFMNDLKSQPQTFVDSIKNFVGGNNPAN